MKKILVSIIAITMIFTTSVSAFEIVDIGPDSNFLNELQRDVASDVAYLKEIANSYSDRFVVKEEKSLDISSIDAYYFELSSPLTLNELDNGATDLSTNLIFDETLKKKMNLFGIFGGLAGYTAEFEPIAYYSIYRNIGLVGGYTKYSAIHNDPDVAYWQCVCTIENLTKEIVPYNSRINMLNKIRELNNNRLDDRTFKIFLLVDGKINSIWERR